jgi:integrase
MDPAKALAAIQFSSHLHRQEGRRAEEGRQQKEALATWRYDHRAALLTGMRSGEITQLTWGQGDLGKRVLTVERAKTSSGTGRQIPMNSDLFAVLSVHAAWFTEKFGQAEPKQYLFRFGRPQPIDPTRPTTTLKDGLGQYPERDRGFMPAARPEADSPHQNG